MFPTHVGMNRKKTKRKVESKDVPHTRGDEPLKDMSGKLDQ